jgi:hypothetical protein
MCYYILTTNGTVITRSKIKALEKPKAPHVRREIKAYDWAVMDELRPTKWVDASDPVAQGHRKKEALKVARRSRQGLRLQKGEPDYETLNRHIFYEINEGTDHEFY